jgi:hypothetical protein
LYLDILRTLEKLNAPYVIIGAFAGASYGVTRVTADVDIVVDLSEAHIEALSATYPPPRFYADPDQMRDSIRLGILFNILVAVRLGDDPELTAMFDTAYVDDWAARLGQEGEELWRRLKVVAQLES